MAMNDEIDSLNLDDLDVEELERRLELVSAGSAFCYSNTECGTYSLCIVNV